MRSLDDPDHFAKVLSIEVPWAHSYADMRPGKTDVERRENYRNAAVGRVIALPSWPLWFAFRIRVRKANRPLDVDNVEKTIIDAFCMRQIVADRSAHIELGLYPDDTFDHVRLLQVTGARSALTDSTRIEVFACINSLPDEEP